MKRFFTLLTCLLAAVLLFAACTPEKAGDQTQDTTTTKPQDDPLTPPDGGEENPDKDPDPTESGEVYGIWFSDPANVVMDISKDSNAVKFYSCTPGYYEYYAVQDATYTYTDGDHTLVLTLEEQPYIFSYDPDEDLLSLTVESKKTEYVRKTELPTEHPSYAFPKYDSMALAGMMKLPTYGEYELWESVLAEARIEIFKTFFANGLETPTEITDRPAAYGDVVSIDYVGKRDGVAFAGGTGSAPQLALIENSGFIPGFAEGVIGHSAGESFEINISFPENYPNAPELAGQPVVFEITLKKVFEVRLTEDQFATFDELPYETYDAWVEETAKKMGAGVMLTKIYEEVELLAPLPTESYMYFYQYNMDYLHYLADSYGLDYETYCTYIGGDPSERFLEQAKAYATDYIICYLIAEQEALTWTEEQEQALFDSFVEELKKSGYTEEDARLYVQNNQMDYLHAELTVEVVQDYLAELVIK